MNEFQITSNKYGHPEKETISLNGKTLGGVNRLSINTSADGIKELTLTFHINNYNTIEFINNDDIEPSFKNYEIKGKES